MRKRTFPIAFTVCGLLPFLAKADVTYTSSASFFAAISSSTQQIENFSMFSNGQLISNGFSANGITYGPFSLSSGATQLDITNLYNSFSGLSLGADHTMGGSFPAGTFFFGGDSATITFASPVNAVGVFFNVNQNSGNYELQGNGTVASTGSAAYDTSTFVFAGITFSTPVTTVSFDSTDPVLGSFNIPEIVSAVPEPSELLPLGAALGLLPLLRRRRRA
jgi:hypothetical protein